MADYSIASFHGSDKFYNPCVGKGKVLFTGPDGISDQNVTIIHPTYVGIGTMSPEGTSDLNYLWRPGRRCAYPPPKSTKVGEIGWGIQLFTDTKRLKSGKQIMRGEFRQECEDRHTHLYQNPWYPGPNDQDDEKKQISEAAKHSSEGGRGSRSEGHYSSRRQSPRSFRSHTPTPTKSPLFEGVEMTRPTPRPRSCTPSSRARSGTVSSSTSMHSQH